MGVNCNLTGNGGIKPRGSNYSSAVACCVLCLDPLAVECYVISRILNIKWFYVLVLRPDTFYRWL